MDRLSPSRRMMTGLLAGAIAWAGLIGAGCAPAREPDEHLFARASQRRLAEDFQKQVAMLATAEKQMTSAEPAHAIPPGFAPWWRKDAGDKLLADGAPSRHSLEDVFTRALKHSSQIRVFRDIPLIRHTGIQEAKGVFDHHIFAESMYELVDEPVGSTLKTGGPDRFKQYEVSVEAGIRRKIQTGADVTLSQKVARTTNNSEFFVPDKQASARLALTITQPLLKGGGVKYNTSLIRIARIDSEIARSEFLRQTESHLLEVARAYWTLYMSRAACIQKRKLAADTADLVAKLEKRSDIDAILSDLTRARAALAKRRADLVRAEMAIRNAEDRLKTLLSDPDLMSPQAEIVPGDEPVLPAAPVDMKACAAAALENRPEIHQAFLQLKAAAIRRNMAKNEVLPQLDLLMETSINGLDRAGRLTDGWDDEWRSHPGFLVGLRFDFPVENNTAEARLKRRRLEIRQLTSQLETTVDTVLLEVKIAAREVQTSQREMQSRHQSLQAAMEDLRTLQQRWESHAGGDARPAANYLQLLIDAQDRLAQAEEDFVRSAVIASIARISLQRAKGTLLTYEDVELIEDTEPLLREGLPRPASSQPASRPAAPRRSAPAAPRPTAAPRPAPASRPAPVSAAPPGTAFPASPAAPVAAAAPAGTAGPASPANARKAALLPVQPPASPAACEVVGILARSELLENRYVLLAPGAGGILAFVESRDARIPIGDYIGKMVRAIGRKGGQDDTLLLERLTVVSEQEAD